MSSALVVGNRTCGATGNSKIYSNMFYPMEEQAAHITRLKEENRRYIREKSNRKHLHLSSPPSSPPMPSPSSPSTASTALPCGSHFLRVDHWSPPTMGGGGGGGGGGRGGRARGADLQDAVASLQLRNSELNLCLEKERERRREVEQLLEREENYVRRLEDCMKKLHTTQVVMDPATYRQLAEAYMVSGRRPSRRPHPHAHTHSHPSDLVCDAPPAHDSALNHPRLSFPTESTSCPSSPKSSSSSSSSSTTSSSSEDSQLFLGGQNELGEGGGRGGGKVEPRGSMNPWDYQKLLESLENLEGGSRDGIS